MPPGDDRHRAAIDAIDAANADDPFTLEHAGEARPKEQLHAELMTEWVLRLRPDADEALLLAARAHHVKRWLIPRSEFPPGRRPYLRWRQALHAVHAALAASLLEPLGYSRAELQRVEELIAKRPDRAQDDDAQALEDALSLVFFQTQLDATLPGLDEAQARRVLGRTWRKMSADGRDAVRGLPLSDAGRAAIRAAIPDFDA